MVVFEMASAMTIGSLCHMLFVIMDIRLREVVNSFMMVSVMENTSEKTVMLGRCSRTFIAVVLQDGTMDSVKTVNSVLNRCMQIM